jgi:hypothetical protein
MPEIENLDCIPVFAFVTGLVAGGVGSGFAYESLQQRLLSHFPSTDHVMLAAKISAGFACFFITVLAGFAAYYLTKKGIEICSDEQERYYVIEIGSPPIFPNITHTSMSSGYNFRPLHNFLPL